MPKIWNKYGTFVTYTFDRLNRLTRVEQTNQSGGNAVADKRIHNTYNSLSQVTYTERFENLTGTYQYTTRIQKGKVDLASEEKRLGKEISIRPTNKENLFRHFVFEVNQSTLKIIWQPHIVSEKQEIDFPLKDLVIPKSKDNFGFGAYVHGGTATIQNVTIQPTN